MQKTDRHRGCHPFDEDIRYGEVKSILSRTSGFIAAAGFTHSLSPARNCSFGCTYCYVPTLRVFGGLTREDWTHWGRFTTFKANAAPLLCRDLRSDQIIYCSPLVDPYQPAEAVVAMMPRLINEMIQHPPRVFVVQTRGPLILRDVDRLAALARRTIVRVSVSLTTNREEVRQRYEPHCAPASKRIEAIHQLREAGLDVYATLAPLLPCDPEELAMMAVQATARDIIADPFHSRDNRWHGAVTREAAYRISSRWGYEGWHELDFQRAVIDRIQSVVETVGRRLGVGVDGFKWLAATGAGAPAAIP